MPGQDQNGNTLTRGPDGKKAIFVGDPTLLSPTDVAAVKKKVQVLHVNVFQLITDLIQSTKGVSLQIERRETYASDSNETFCFKQRCR